MSDADSWHGFQAEGGEGPVGHLRRIASAGGEEPPFLKGGRRVEGVAEREIVPAEDHAD